MPQLIAVRHGETELNAARVMQPPGTPLSARGRAQADAVAERLLDVKAVAVLASDLPRAEQTARVIADRTGLPLVTTPLLHERNFGDLRGRPHASIGFDPLAMTDAPPNGESMAEFHERCDRAFAAALSMQAERGGALIVVSHGLVIGAWLRRRLQVLRDAVLPQRIGNTSLTTFDAAPPHQAHLIDCTQHLAGRLAEDGSSLSGG